MFDHQPGVAHPRNPLTVLACALMALAGCGGGTTSDAPTPTAPPGETAQRVTPLPFWAEDAPVRPSLRHMFTAESSTTGPVTALSADEARQVRAAGALGAGEHAAALPAGVAVQRRTVTGLFSDSFHTATGATQLPLDLSFDTVEALAPDGSGGFERIAATSRRSDGTYLINAVPEGAHWVRINNTYVWTPASFINWGTDAFGRIDSEAAANPTPLTINASNLATWQANDRLAWTVPMQGTSFALPLTSPSIRNTPVTGDTALGDFVLDFGPDPTGAIFIPLLSAAKGDQAYLNQLGTAPGNDYRTLVRSLVLPALTQTDGAATTVNSGFLDIASSSTLRLKWERPAFASRAGEVNPTAVGTSSVLALSTSALAPDYGVPSDAFSLLEFNTFGSSSLDFGRVHYGNPFPADWAQIIESYHGFTVRYMAPGATVALPVERFLYGVDLVPTASADPSLTLRPRMSPVLSPQVNGRSLFTNQLAVGASPRFTWQVPAVGTPDRYLVTLRRLFASGPRSESRTVGRFYTSDTTMDVPPGVLQPGEVYFLTISAIAAGSPVNEPARSQLPYSFATVMSALISP